MSGIRKKRGEEYQFLCEPYNEIYTWRLEGIIYFLFFFDVVEMEYVMRLYLGLDSMTAMSDEMPKVEVHYVLHYDLIKLHKIILIFLQQGTPL